jgi:hypothetical protein
VLDSGVATFETSVLPDGAETGMLVPAVCRKDSREADPETAPALATDDVAAGVKEPESPGSVIAVTAKTATGTAIAAAENSVFRDNMVHQKFCWRIEKMLQQRNVSVQTLVHDFSARLKNHRQRGQSL